MGGSPRALMVAAGRLVAGQKCRGEGGGERERERKRLSCQGCHLGLGTPPEEGQAERTK